MNSIYIASMLVHSFFAGKLEVAWGTSDTVLTFGQEFFCWAMYKNNESSESITINRERSRIDFYIKTLRGEYRYGGVKYEIGDEISLRPKNSLISHYAMSTRRKLIDISNTQIAVLVARSPSGDYIKDSSIAVRITPPDNIELVKWFYSFDSLRNGMGGRLNNDKRKEICRIADSLHKKANPSNVKNSIISIYARRELAMYCGGAPYICYGSPNLTTSYVRAFDSCVNQACNEGKRLEQMRIVNCPNLYRERNSLTNRILKYPKRVTSDIEGFVKFSNQIDTVYFSKYEFEQPSGK